MTHHCYTHATSSEPLGLADPLRCFGCRKRLRPDEAIVLDGGVLSCLHCIGRRTTFRGPDGDWTVEVIG